MDTRIKSMSYEQQLSREAERLIKQGWFKNFKMLEIIYCEMQLKFKR